jgi:PTS system maltose and glucose-specific IIC component
MTVVWPHFQKLIFGLGGLVDATGYLGTLLYGFILRMLGPLGLHHIFYLPFWTTALGGVKSSTVTWWKVRSAYLLRPAG